MDVPVFLSVRIDQINAPTNVKHKGTGDQIALMGQGIVNFHTCPDGCAVTEFIQAILDVLVKVALSMNHEFDGLFTFG